MIERTKTEPVVLNMVVKTRNFALVGLRAWVAGACIGVCAAGAATPSVVADVRRDAVVAAVERALPSVVNIGTETIIKVRDPFDELYREFFDPYHRRQAPGSQYSLGSGVIIDELGYVLTNDHVVRRADKIWVKLSTGTNIYEATVVATDNQSDVSLLKLKAKPGEKFAAITFARDDDLLLGETVLALGNPFGLGASVSRGILSSKSRVSPMENQPLDIGNWLQTDAPINFGNSGGPLVNLQGELIGLNVAVLKEAQGIGFAIPVKQVSESLSEMLTPESSADRLWFGARVKAGASPLVITAVQMESPAAKAGLKPGDILLQVNGRTPKGFVEFTGLLVAGAKSGVALVTQRGGERHNVTVRLVPENSFFNAALIEQKIGVSLQELTPQLAEAFGLNSTEGFVVAGADRALSQMLQPGCLVTSVDGRRPADLTEAAKILYPKKKGDKVRLGVVVHERLGNFIVARPGVAEVTVR